MAQARDHATVQRVLHFATDLHGEEACGAAPLNGAALAARHHGLLPRALGQCTSGDTAGATPADRARVVGYGAIAFDHPPAPQGDGSRQHGEAHEISEASNASHFGTAGELSKPDAAGTACAADVSDATDADAVDAADHALGRSLVAAARHNIARALGLLPSVAGAPPESRPAGGAVSLADPLAGPVPDHPALSQLGATFVTLHGADGQLRGCVGRLEAVRALGDDVRANALAAAFEDTRFAPLRAHEWPGVRVEVSLLSPAEPLAARSEDEAVAVAALRPGIDGVIFEWRGARATLLPQVWQQLPDAASFLAALKRKAGLPADFWAPDVRLSRYRVRSFVDASLSVA